MHHAPLFSVIVPSRGTRPRALSQALSSVETSMRFAGLDEKAVEVLIGFDGVQGERVHQGPFTRYFDLPKDGNWGNGIRNILLHQAKGRRVVFLDDDNALTDDAFSVYLDHMDVELLISRIDTSLAFDRPFLPSLDPDKPLVRQGNIDPLCLCLSTDLVRVRCKGWQSLGNYEADYLNMLYYWRRARSKRVVEDVVGVYDAGGGLDAQGVNFRQQCLITGNMKSRAGW